MFLTRSGVEGRKSKKSEKENGGKNPLWAKKHLLVVAYERFPAVNNGTRCPRGVLPFYVLQYFSIRVIASLDFNDAVCCINICYDQLKWVWNWHPCAPNQILMKARGSKEAVKENYIQLLASLRLVSGQLPAWPIMDKCRSWRKWLWQDLGGLGGHNLDRE